MLIVNEYIVVVERTDADPAIVGFRDKDQADAWVSSVNLLAQEVWPDSYHNYARLATEPMTPEQAYRCIIDEVRKAPR